MLHNVSSATLTTLLAARYIIKIIILLLLYTHTHIRGRVAHSHARGAQH